MRMTLSFDHYCTNCEEETEHFYVGEHSKNHWECCVCKNTMYLKREKDTHNEIANLLKQFYYIFSSLE